MNTALASPPLQSGKYKSLGPYGPVYQIGRVLRPLSNGDWMVEITLVETGEKAEYRLTQISDDPEAH